MKQRFQVHQNGILAAGQKVLKVKISGLQHVKNGQILSLPFIEAADFFMGPAACGVDELHPAMSFPIQYLQSTKLRICAFLVHPPYEVLKIFVNGDGSGFINKLKSALKSCYENGPATAVRVACASSGFHQEATLGSFVSGAKVEQIYYLIPIDSQPFEKLGAIADPILNTGSQTARQHGIFREKRQRYIPAGQTFREIGEALRWRRSLQHSF